MRHGKCRAPQFYRSYRPPSRCGRGNLGGKVTRRESCRPVVDGSGRPAAEVYSSWRRSLLSEACSVPA